MESVFSIYNAIIVANLHEKFIIVQHQIYDGLVHPGRVGNVEITEPIVKNVYIFHSLQRCLETKKKKKAQRKKRESTKTISYLQNQGYESEKAKT